MKILRPLSILALIVCLPVAGSAQIIFERLNQGDPPGRVVDKEKDGDDPKSDEQGEEKEEPKGFTDSELDEIRDVLTVQLQQTHQKCMEADEIRRPSVASITGTAVWAVDKEGKAKFKSTSCKVSPDMFFESAEEQNQLTDLMRQGAENRGNEIYNECAKGTDAEVPVQGKSGDVTLKFSVKWEKNKAVVNVQDN